MTQGLERAGSAGITTKGRRVNGWRTKHNYYDDDEGENDSDKVKDLGVPNRQRVIGGKGWRKSS